MFFCFCVLNCIIEIKSTLLNFLSSIRLPFWGFDSKYSWSISISISILVIVFFLSQDVLRSLWSQRGLYCFYQWIRLSIGLLRQWVHFVVSFWLFVLMTYAHDLWCRLSIRSIFPQSFPTLRARTEQKQNEKRKLFIR